MSELMEYSTDRVDLREALKRGSADEAMAVLKPLDAQGVASVLRDAGFVVDPMAVERGRNAVFTSVKEDLGAALKLRTDGFGLRQSVTQQDAGVPEKAMDVALQEFHGDVDAARMVQRVLSASMVSVGLLGDASHAKRGSLLLVAAQGLQNGIQGFGFDGIPGKYQVPLSMAQLHDLHQVAAQTVAEDSARLGLKAWAAGDKGEAVNEFVLDSVQRLLHGSVSMDAAQAIVQSIEHDGIGRHAREIGSHKFTALLASQGLDVNAPSLEEHVERFGLTLMEPDRGRGQYFGTLIASDHRAGVIKVSRTDAIELPFSALPKGQARPKLGDALRLGFKGGSVTVTVAHRAGREAAVR